MNYDAYEAKILKIAAVLAKLRKYRVLIISILAAVALALVGFVATKGMVISGVDSPAEGIVYGEEPSFGANALFGKVRYEYCIAGSDEWSDTAPYMPGSYMVRTVTKRSFGIVDRGDPVEFEIKPKPIKISLLSTSVQYGDTPVISSMGLVRGDSLVNFLFEYEGTLGDATVTVGKDTLKILSENGDDVTSAYEVQTEEYYSITVIPRPITVTFTDKEKVYDGLPLSSNDFTISAGSLFGSDEISLGSAAEFTDVAEGGYLNLNEDLRILDSSGDDITANYAVTILPGRITIYPRPIEVISSGAEKIYDGAPLTNPDASLLSGELVGGHSLVYDFTGSLVFAGEAENSFAASVKNEYGHDVSDNYEITHKFGALKVARRPLQLIGSSYTWIYSGSEYAAKNLFPYFSVGEADKDSGLVEGAWVECDSLSGSITFVGSTASVLSGAHIFDANGNDATESYEITYTEGVLSVLPRPIIVTAGSGSLEYNGLSRSGSELLSGAYTVTHGALPDIDNGEVVDTYYGDYAQTDSPLTDGLIVEYDSPLGIINVGIYENSITNLRIVDGEGMDHTPYYSIETESGSLEITQRPITVCAPTVSFMYNGLMQGAGRAEPGFIYRGGYMGASPLVSGHTFDIEYNGKRADQGTTDLTVADFGVFDENGTPVTDNYDIEYAVGTLEITRRPITVTLADYSWEYDGLTHYSSEIASPFSFALTGDPTGEALVLDHSFSMPTFGSVRIVETAVHAVGGDYVITDGEGNKVTSNYLVDIVTGTLEITPRYIKIKTASGEKIYDATPLTARDYTVIGGSLAPGQSISYISYTNEPTNVSVNDNLVDITITDEYGEITLPYYNVEFEHGTLTVTQRPIVITAVNKTWIYDGGVHNADNLEYSVICEQEGDGRGIIVGHTAVCVVSGSISSVGKVASVITEYAIISPEGDLTDNYLVQTVDGSFEVIPRPINVFLASSSLEYDGKIHTGMEFFDPSLTARGTLPTLPAGEPQDFGVAVGDFAFFGDHAFTYTSEEFLNFGSYTNSALDFDVISGGESVLSNYDISITDGEIDIYKRKIGMSFQGGERVYDGLMHTASMDNLFAEYLGTVPGAEAICSGHTYSAVGSVEFKYVGKYDISLDSVLILDADGNPVTDNYDITLADATVDVIPRKVYVVLGSASVEYDGREHSISDIKNIASFYFLQGEGDAFPAGDRFIFDSTVAPIKNCGTSQHTILPEYGVADANGTNVTSNYEITVDSGTLEVYKRSITVSTPSADKVYDGIELSANSLTVTMGSLVGGHRIANTEFIDPDTGRVSALTDAGVLKNCACFDILSESDEPVTDNYDITYHFGELRVDQRPIELTAADLSVIYDAKYHTGAEATIPFTITEGTTVLGHTVSVEFIDPVAINAGLYTNAIYQASVFDGIANKTLNYTFTYVDGALEIQRRAITLQSEDYEFTYDGNSHRQDPALVTLVGGTLVPGHVFDCEIVTEATYVSDTGAGIEFTVNISNGWVDDVPDENYEITYQYGEYTVNARPITVTALDYEVVYRGDAFHQLPENHYSITEGSLADGDEPDFQVGLYDAIDVGEYPLVFIYAEVYRGSAPVTENYSITTVDGTVTVVQKKITLTSESAEKIYDGAPLAPTGVDTSELCHGHYLSNLTFTNHFSDIGVGENIFTFDDIVDAGGRVVTPNYDVEYSYGSLRIISGILTVYTDSDSKTYDATPLTAPGYTLDGEMLTGHSAFVVVTGSITDYGSTSNTFEIMIVDGGGNELHDTYTVVDASGTLTVNKRDLTVNGVDKSKVYDGTPLTDGEFNSDGLIEGHWIFDIEFFGSVTDYGTTVTNDFTVHLIIDDYGNFVTENYNVIKNPGVLWIDKKPITVTSADAEKIYDGEPLITYDFDVDTELVSGHSVKLTPETTSYNIGTWENIFTAQVIVTESGEDVTYNYDITRVFGTLKIISGEITVTTRSDSKYYDGTALKSDVPIFSGVLLITHKINIVVTGSQTVVGESPNTFTYTIVDIDGNVIESSETPEEEKLYKLTSNIGTLVVEQPVIKIFTGSKYVNDNGLPLSFDEHQVEGVFYDGDYIVVTVTGIQVGIGSSKNTFTYKIFNVNGELIQQTETPTEECKYVIEKHLGMLEIIEEDAVKYDLTIESVTDMFTYDGTSHNADEYEIVEGTLAEGHTINVIFDHALRVTPSVYPNDFTVEIYDEYGVNVTGQYMIKKLTGAIHVNKRHIMILTASDEKKYDGKPLAASGYEIISGELLPDHYLSVDNQGAQITVGESKNIAYASVVDKDGNVLDGLYEVEIEYGTLRVTSSVVISPMELHIAYDGRAHYYSDYYTDPYNSVWVSEGKEFLPEGFRIYADVEGARTDVGISYSTITSFKVLDKNGNDITEYCNVGKADAMFEIVPIRITITTGSAEKDYDGSALVNKTYWVSVGKLYTGHKLTLTVTGKQVVPGESENKINIDSVMIVDGNGRNVTSFYTIDYAYGTLKVNNP